MQDRLFLGSTAAKPGELLPMASESLQSTIEQPMYGKPHAPTRVRVASAELADALRSGHPGLDVVCAPTPELDEMLTLMREKMAEDGATEQSYLSPEITPEAVAAFFKAAAALFRAKPWKLEPDDQSLFSVTIEQLGMRDAAMSVIGQTGQSLGLILFSGIDDFEAYLDAAEVIELGEQPEMPPHFVLNFERGAELAPELRKEISEHHWEVAGANAYPWLVAVDEELVARPPTGKEVTMAEAIASALTNVMAEKKALRKAWDGGEPVARTLSLTTHAGEIEVTPRAPYMRAPVEFDPSHDILADLAALSRDEYEIDDDEIDDDAREALEDELVRRFAASPEARDLDEIHACRFVMDLGANYIGHTIATLGATELGAFRAHPTQCQHRGLGGARDRRGDGRLLHVLEAGVRAEAGRLLPAAAGQQRGEEARGGSIGQQQLRHGQVAVHGGRRRRLRHTVQGWHRGVDAVHPGQAAAAVDPPAGFAATIVEEGHQGQEGQTQGRPQGAEEEQVDHEPPSNTRKVGRDDNALSRAAERRR